ncbi:MAG: transcriptional regulator, LysR family protein [Herminiimonas sp.]|nr:transcriptional regulator, LysR family protein [Herminiimonas sp.]
MADDISDLRLLTQLVAAGSLTEASKRLNSSLPAVSRRLADMESRLGVRLIERHARRFRLTEEGEALYERALHIVAEVDEAEAEASARGKAPQGRLRVICPVQIGRQRIAPLAARFSALNPGVHIELVLSDAVIDVTADEADLALHVGLPTNQSMVARLLLASRRVVCASPAYLAAHGAPQRPEDLSAHQCLRLVRGRRLIDRWRFECDGAIREMQVSGRLSTTSSEVLYQWALEGYGIGIKALWDIEEDLATGRLVECLAPFACDNIDLFVVYASRPLLPLRMRAFTDYLIKQLGRGR